ncbi:hypothetical protein [Leuconostoc rapi]|uniref:hypothetical protein n=1 Tax=Leuconostoc rapi TaxID=1406906 RepID=UPI00195A381B|nr:hypothetical protein [Leuconostoc rapi]MBM7436241.1 hypothetical protein [Leuconostoc rapi]
MNKPRSGAIFVSAIIMLGMLGGLFVLQTAAFNAQLGARAKMITLAKIETIQLKASLTYHENKQTDLKIENAQIIIVEKDILIKMGNKTYVRELLVKTP